jgi:hypothetical protein
LWHILNASYNIQFHHIFPAEKVSEVHKIAKSGDLKATIAELDKCLPVCDPDHRAIHKGLRRGWLSGQFDNGKPSDALLALPYMPYLPWLAKQKPRVFQEFYRQNVQSAHDVLWPFISDKPQRPKLMVVK